MPTCASLSSRYAVPMRSDDAADDSALFRAAIGKVEPMRRTASAAPRKPPPKPAARMAECDEDNARSEFQRLLDGTAKLEAGDSSSYRRANVPAHVFQRLKRGQFSIQDELDLHGANVTQAESLLRQFLADAHVAGFGCVRIIHGKGLQSDNRAPVLKNLVDRMLRQRADVHAFHSAPPAQGGTGAVLVLLAKRG